MEYTVKEISMATEVLAYLMAKKKLTSRMNKELYDLYYGNKEVQDIFRDCFEPSLKVKVFRHYETVYLVPEMENDYLAYSNAELESLMGFKNSGQVKLNQFIWLVILAEFYGSNFIVSGEPNQFVKKIQIVNKVHFYIEQFEKEYKQNGDQFSYAFKIDFGHLIETWYGLSETTELTENKRTAKTHEGFVDKVLKLYEKEFELLMVVDGDEIVLTEKAKAIMVNCYHDDERIDKISDLLNGKYTDVERVEYEDEIGNLENA